jgi:hypothetical protein
LQTYLLGLLSGALITGAGGLAAWLGNRSLAKRAERRPLRASARFYLGLVRRVDEILACAQSTRVWPRDELEDDDWARHGPLFRGALDRARDAETLEETHRTVELVRWTQASGIEAEGRGYVFASRDFATIQGFRSQLSEGVKVLERLAA